MAKKQGLTDIDRYIATFPVRVQAILKKVRQTIRDAAPDAKETISYRMPAFRWRAAAQRELNRNARPPAA